MGLLEMVAIKTGEISAAVGFSMARARRAYLESPFNPFACGYTDGGFEYHDHDVSGHQKPANALGHKGHEWVHLKGHINFLPYRPKQHGEVTVFIAEGQEVPGAETPAGFVAIHNHDGTLRRGPYEYVFIRR